MKKLLLTGFEAFGDWDVNPTEVAVNKIDGIIVDGTTICGRVVPLRYKEIQVYLRRYIEETDPMAIIMTGQAGGDHIRLEKIAKNIVDAKLPYNCGTVVENKPIIAGGEQELKSTLALEKMYDVLKTLNIPVEFSDSAGSFGCNQIYYLAQSLFPSLPSGFIHVPLLPEQTSPDKSSMEQNIITQAIETCCRVQIKYDN